MKRYQLLFGYALPKELQDLIESLEKTPDESAKAILHCKSILTEKLTKMREKKLRLILKKS